MHTRFFLLSAAALWAAYSCSAFAKNIGNEQIPKPVFDKFRQTYPDAKDMQAEAVTHFNVPLIKIAFKNGEQPEVEYYRPNGAKFVNGFSVNEDEIPLEMQQSLKNEFPDYRIKAVTLIVNPNGVGREYEVDVTAAGANWEYIADESGTILNKTQD